MIKSGSVIIDAYRTYNTSYRTVMEGFVGSGDPELHFVYDELKNVLHLTVIGDCVASDMRERVRSMGHNLYLPFTKSLQDAVNILKKICREYTIDNSFKPTSYSNPEKYVTGFVEVPEIIVKYGHVSTMTPSFYWDWKTRTSFISEHRADKERMFVEWENPREGHTKWKKTIWMKDEFHYGFRCKGFNERKEFEPFIENAILIISLPKDEVGRLSGLMNKMLDDYKIYGDEIKRRREK